MLPDQRSSTVTAWLREHPGVRVMCQDGAEGFAHAALGAIVQFMDRPWAWPWTPSNATHGTPSPIA